MLISLTHGSSTKCLGEPFSSWTTCFLPAEFRQSLFSEHHPLMKTGRENISCHSVVCLFHSLNSIFHRASIFTFDEYFIFYGLCFDVMTKTILSNTWYWRFFFFQSFIVLDFTRSYMVHFATLLKFLYKVWDLGQDSVICLGISDCP